MTATHQLKSAVTSVAFAGRSLFFASLPDLIMDSSNVTGANSFADLLIISLSNSLLGMDANDPPKTLATMQLIGSLFSNVSPFIQQICFIRHYNGVILSHPFHLQMSTLDDDMTMNEGSVLPSFCFSEWLDEFLCRLFALLQHLEPSNIL